MEQSTDITRCLSKDEVRKRMGISTHVIGSDRLEPETLRRIRRSGIPNIELCAMSPSHYDIQDRAQTAEVEEACQELGLGIVSVHAEDTHCGTWMSSAAEKERRAAIDYTVETARVAERLGAAVVVTHCGTSAAAEENMSEALSRLGDSPATLTIENGLGPGATFELESCRAFCERVDSPGLGITVDIGHLVDYVAEPDVIHPLFEKGGALRELSKCGPYLRHLHLHDSRSFETRFSHHGAHNDHYPPFLGQVDWQDLFAALGEVDYAGAFVFEPIGWFSERITAALTESSHDARGDERDVFELVAAFPDKLLG